MSDPLATLDALAEEIGEEFDAADPNPSRMLGMASMLIRARAHETFSSDTEDVELRGNWTSELQLPRPPVSAVSTVELRSEGAQSLSALSETGYSWDRSGRLFHLGGYWGGALGVVHVVYSRGYEEVPEKIQTVCLALAKRLLVYSTRFSDQQIQASEAGVSVGFTELESEILRDYDPTRIYR